MASRYLILLILFACSSSFGDDLAPWREHVFSEPVSPETRVSVSYYGVSTLVFDDGETQVLIDGYFTRPDWVWNYKEGGSVSILLEHPAGSVIIQGSGGYVKDALLGVEADTVFSNDIEFLLPSFLEDFSVIWQELADGSASENIELKLLMQNVPTHLF